MLFLGSYGGSCKVFFVEKYPKFKSLRNSYNNTYEKLRKTPNFYWAALNAKNCGMNHC